MGQPLEEAEVITGIKSKTLYGCRMDKEAVMIEVILERQTEEHEAGYSEIGTG